MAEVRIEVRWLERRHARIVLGPVSVVHRWLAVGVGGFGICEAREAVLARHFGIMPDLEPATLLLVGVVLDVRARQVMVQAQAWAEARMASSIELSVQARSTGVDIAVGSWSGRKQSVARVLILDVLEGREEGPRGQWRAIQRG